MHARICELENGSAELRQQLAAGAKREEVASVEQREAADEQAEHKLRPSCAPVLCTDSAAEPSMLGGAASHARSEIEMVPGVDVAVRSYATILHLPMSDVESIKRPEGRGAVRSAKPTCCRCGGCDHSH